MFNSSPNIIQKNLHLLAGKYFMSTLIRSVSTKTRNSSACKIYQWDINRPICQHRTIACIIAGDVPTHPKCTTVRWVHPANPIIELHNAFPLSLDSSLLTLITPKLTSATVVSSKWMTGEQYCSFAMERWGGRLDCVLGAHQSPEYFIEIRLFIKTWDDQSITNIDICATFVVSKVILQLMWNVCLKADVCVKTCKWFNDSTIDTKSFRFPQVCIKMFLYCFPRTLLSLNFKYCE